MKDTDIVSSNRWKVLFLLILLVFTLPVSAYKNNWWAISPTGSTDEFGQGNTAGQTFTGSVSEGAHQGTYGFWTEEMMPIVCFTASRDTWDLDSIDVLEARSMVYGEQIELTNCGNCHLCFGLSTIYTTPTTWASGYTTGDNRYVLRARFTDSPVPPVVYDMSRDYISDAIKWASPVFFGGAGNDFDLSDEQFLWLQFVAPNTSEEWGDNNIVIELLARVNLW
mgnify:CR=1 FL=1